MAKTVKKKAAKKATKPPARPERIVNTYRIIAAGREPELVRCHALSAYGGTVEFERFIDTPRDFDGDWTTILVLAPGAFERVELVEEAPAVPDSPDTIP